MKKRGNPNIKYYQDGSTGAIYKVKECRITMPTTSQNNQAFNSSHLSLSEFKPLHNDFTDPNIQPIGYSADLSQTVVQQINAGSVLRLVAVCGVLIVCVVLILIVVAVVSAVES